MAKFLLENNVQIVGNVNKISQSWLVDFDLPESVKEKMAWDEVIKIHGCFLMVFYDAPMIGDRVEYKGHEWRIIERCLHLTRHRSNSEAKRVPLLRVEYLGKIPAIQEEIDKS